MAKINVGESFGMAMASLWSNKLRTFLTVFGLVWGTVAVTLLLAFGTGLKKQLVKSTAGLGDRICIAWPGLTSIPYEGLGKGRRIRLTEEDVDILAETGASTGAIQIAGTDSVFQLPFFITACDYTLIGEELYAASAYLSREPLLLGSLKGQDYGKLVIIAVAVIGSALLLLSKIPALSFFGQIAGFFNTI